MIKRPWSIIIFLIPVVVLIGIACFYFSCRHHIIEDYVVAERTASIHPDYTEIVIPPNIAPLNFMVQEAGRRYQVKIYGDQGQAIDITGSKPEIVIPAGPWKKLLDDNRGGDLYYDIYVEQESGSWLKFEPIRNSVAREGIDRYLAYRKIEICVRWTDMGIYQRDLESFNESIVLHNSTFDTGCVHCHRFRNNNPDGMLLQVRSVDYGTPMLKVQDGKVIGLNTKTEISSGKVGFTSWHPNGNIVAFSLNQYSMLYHTAAHEVRDVFDNGSDLALYQIDTEQVFSTGKITQPDRLETFPEWSVDGRYLYFCSAPQLPADQHAQVQCDLMRISFDSDSGEWGQLETVLTAQQVQGSITQPRFSPDGRFCIFNLSPYSDFPIHQARSDLFLLEIETGQFRKLSISSHHCDTWHSWSSDNRWLAFTSKRLDGRFARLFLSYIDSSGEAHKAFVLPQQDPCCYDSMTRVYNMPELLVKSIKVKPSQLSRAIIDYKKAIPADAITGATPGRPLPKGGHTSPSQSPWKQIE